MYIKGQIMKKKLHDTSYITDNHFLVNDRLRSNFVEFVTKLVASEHRKRPVSHRKGAQGPKGETPGAE